MGKAIGRGFKRALRAVSGLVVLSWGTAFGASPQHLFDGPVFPMGVRAWTIDASDLDHDGNLDLLLVDTHVHTLEGFGAVVRLMGNGDGTFGQRILIDSGMEPFDAILSDPNNDGKPDIVAAGISGPYVLPGNGDGTFGERVLIPVPDPDCRGETVRDADFDGDGIKDLLVNCAPVFVLLGTGDDSFYSPAVQIAASSRLVPGDFDGDGDVDIATTKGGHVALLPGNGDGTFAPVQEFDHVVQNRMAAGDANGDGRPDLVVELPSYEFAILLGANGGFEAEYASQLQTSLERVTSITFDDFNADGYDDLLLTYVASSCNALFYSNGDGTFGPETCYETVLGGGYAGAAVGDFTGDGVTDLALTSWVGYSGLDNDKVGTSIGIVHLLKGGGGGGFLAEPLPPELPVGSGPADVVVEDLNGDGVPDIATVNTESSDVSVLLGVGSGGFLAGSDISVSTGPVALSAGRIDGGNTMDLVVGHENSPNLAILLGNGDGTFMPASLVPVAGAADDVAIGDLNGDGLNDVAVSHSNLDSVEVLFGNGDGTFASPVAMEVGVLPHAVTIADVSGSDAPDLLVANESSQDVSVFVGIGGGNFAPETRVNAGTSAQYLAVADLDHDGDRDIVVASAFDFDSRWVTVVRNDGLGGFAAPQVTNLDTQPWDLALADLDGDGWADIITPSPGASFLTVGLGGPELGAYEPVSFAIWGSLGSVATGDLDGDGRVDIAHAGSEDSVTLLFNKNPLLLRFGPDSTTLTWPITVGTVSHEVYRGELSDLVDPDADGLPDGGYGACISVDDPDPGDNVFADATVPLSGQGYFYLMARIGGPPALGLGTTSSGQPRIPSVPCASP